MFFNKNILFPTHHFTTLLNDLVSRLDRASESPLEVTHAQLGVEGEFPGADVCSHCTLPVESGLGESAAVVTRLEGVQISAVNAGH